MIDADALRSQLSARDYRRILQKCGFKINGESGTELSGILGPKELGEGSEGNFSINLKQGLVKDWGSSGYEGSVFDVVMDVHGLSFNESLEWIVNEFNLGASALRQESSNESPSEASVPDLGSPNAQSEAPDPVVSHEQVERWRKRLTGETHAAQAARRYLTVERGIHSDVLKRGHVGLAYKTEIPDEWGGFYRREARPVTWWIIFPVARRDLDGAPIVSVKGVGFDPENCDWKRDENGEKVPSNVSSALWDLVPTEENGTPRIDGPVLVCEGELDALCAFSNGFNAVTGTAGAKTFKPEWARYLASLAPAQEYGVVVVFDGDETGQEGAQNAGRRLHDAGLDVRVASLPNGTDVNDLLVESGRETLRTHIDQANAYEPPEVDADDADSGTTGKSPDVQPLLGTEEPEPMKWRVSDFVPEDHLTMLVGDGGTGKSILALYLSLCISTGRPFLETQTRRGRVLYVDHELDRDEQLRRVHRIARGMALDAGDTALRDRFLYWRPHNPLGSEEHQEALLEAVSAHEIDLVILDSLTMGAEGDVTDVADVVPIMQHIRQWPTTVAIDHVSHDTAKRSAAQARAFGSVFKRNAARSSLTLATSDTGGYCIQQEKSNFSEGDGRLVYAVDWAEDEITFESISDADERAAGLLSDLSSKDVTLVAVKEEYEALKGAVLAENVVQWREQHDEVSSVAKKTVQNHFSALKRRGDLIGADGEGVLPASAEHEAEAPF